MAHTATPRAVLDARRRFFDTGQTPIDGVAETILRSWQRCSALGLDAHAAPSVEALGAAALAAERERQERLRRLCAPEMEALRDEARTADAIVVLTDPTGLVLDVVGSAAFAGRAAGAALRPGVPWAESSTGTNAIGAAIVERRAAEVHGAEHFFDPHRFLTCSAVPILDPRGALAGVLDLSGPATVRPLHALGLVRQAVDQIEHRWFEHGFERCDVVRCHLRPELLGTPLEGILAFDDGRLVGANRHALALLGLSWRALDTVSVDDLFAALPAGRGVRRAAMAGATAPLVVDVRPARSTARPSRPIAAALPAPLFDPVTELAMARAATLLDAEVAVLVQGETGSGKEVFARGAHAASRLAGRPFVAINCAALPEGLIESELFGYQEGAFTGARRQGSRGRLREADGGVLFLDEIGDMPLAAQARLLRVLQDREVTPLGGGRPVAVRFALLSATNRELAALVAKGAFRTDLYFRLAQYTVTLPAVRELADIGQVVDGVVAGLAGASGVRLSAAARTALAAYHWPGNFRQLTNTLRAVVALAAPGQAIALEALPAEIRGAAPDPVEAAPSSIEAVTRSLVARVLAECNGNVSAAARRLGVHRSTLYRRQPATRRRA